MTVRLSLQPALDLLATSYFKKIIVPAQALTFLSALITFCVMCVYSQSAETAQSALETALNRFMLYVVENGGAAMIVHLFYLVVVSPHSNLTVGRVADSVTPPAVSDCPWKEVLDSIPAHLPPTIRCEPFDRAQRPHQRAREGGI